MRTSAAIRCEPGSGSEDVSPEISARLAAFQIQTVAESKEYFMLVRENCVAIVHRTESGYSLGSSGLMTESGLAYLVWREGKAMLAGKGRETSAEEWQTEALRVFSSDVKSALFPQAR